MAKGNSNLVDLDVTLHHETEKAWLVSMTGYTDDAKWVPKAVAELDVDSKPNVLTLPEQFAIDKGLI